MAPGCGSDASILRVAASRDGWCTPASKEQPACGHGRSDGWRDARRWWQGV